MVKKGDIAEIDTIEHELTHEEECVTCTYALKAKGKAKDALLRYLKKDGFSLDKNKLKKINPKFDAVNVF